MARRQRLPKGMRKHVRQMKADYNRAMPEAQPLIVERINQAYAQYEQQHKQNKTD